MRAATVLRRSGWSAEMFKPGEPIEITGAPRSLRLALVLREHGGVRRRHDRRPLRAAREARGRGGACARRRARTLPSGEPNISGDWAPEQLVMTDPRGRGGALVPVSRVEQFRAGRRHRSPARRRGARAGRAARDRTSSRRRGQDGRRGLRRLHARQSALALRDDQHPVRLDVRRPGQPHHAERRHDHAAVRAARLHAHDPHERDEHPGDVEPSRAGHSIGRWENDVLVVDTVGFAPGVLSPP